MPIERRGKIPVADGWSVGPRKDLEELITDYGEGEPGYNVGIRCGEVEGAPTPVIMVDGDSVAALQWMRANLPETNIRTLTCKGEHWFYRAPGRAIGNKVKVAVEIGGAIVKVELDIRANGGLAVAPGSIHGTGVQYCAPPELRWTEERVASMPIFDPSWFKGCEWQDGAEFEVEGQEPAERNPPVDVELQARRSRAVRYLDACPPTVSGQGTASSECLFYSRALVWGLCLPPVDAAHIMARHKWNFGCTNAQGDPYPWSLDELLHKCRDAYRLKYDKPYGWLLLERARNVPDENGPPVEDPLANLVAEERQLEVDAQGWEDFYLESAVIESPAKFRWPRTDSGAAERLAARFGGDIRWLEDQGVWRVWDAKNGRWVVRSLALERCAKETARLIAKEVPAAEELLAKAAAAHRDALATGVDLDTRKEELENTQRNLDGLRRFQLKSESVASREAMIKLARAEKGIATSTATFDRDPMLLNVKNGVLDLGTLADNGLPRMLPHDRRWYLTKTCLVNWEPEATAPLWDRCLKEWTGGNAELENYLKRVAGYVLTGSTIEQCVFFFYGGGLNGKSTFVNALMSILGPYATSAPADLLMEQRTDKASASAQAGLASLLGSRLVIATESSESARIDARELKKLRSSEPVKVKFMRENPFDMMVTFKTILTMNPKPRITETDDGTWRSFHLVHWAHKVKNPDKELYYRLIKERPGILKWAVEGCLEWRAKGLQVPPAILEEHEAYRKSQDSFGQFLDTFFAPGFSYESKIYKTDLAALYERFCDDEDLYAIKGERIAQELARRFEEDLQGKQLDGRDGRGRYWRGLKRLN